ncbi:hypothetical protein RND71_010112 [Anisodus tanguticus]|uniref:Uncharacterized protein n=1 Tax=Anisodus tanguticus TaxID=243964 RepID=A0AAE1SJQ6_9SOLA|nr:hypothetical protein RND71_010112 [Anisodus tanguticus]
MESSRCSVGACNNRFVGKFPDVVVQLPNLKFLDLRFNEFEGGIPRGLHWIAKDFCLIKLIVALSNVHYHIHHLPSTKPRCTCSPAPPSPNPTYPPLPPKLSLSPVSPVEPPSSSSPPPTHCNATPSPPPPSCTPPPTFSPPPPSISPPQYHQVKICLLLHLEGHYLSKCNSLGGIAVLQGQD